MKKAFLFPGQGAQTVGMGKDIAEKYESAAKIFNTANDIVGYNLRSICFEGPADKLNTTTISQPAIFTVSAAILEVLKTENGTRSLVPDVTAGLSLGEYTALYAADIINFEQGLQLVQIRGRAMQQAADQTEGSMVSIIGLDKEKIKQLCEQASQGELLNAVNFNCPGQIVISGTVEACERAENLATELGAIKAIRLDVAGAFHTEMMKSASDKLSEALGNSDIADPADIKTIANIRAEYYDSADQIRDGLIQQLTSPILWQKCMEKLLEDGVEEFYEIGPGKVLTGLMRRIHRKTKVTNISTFESLNHVLMK